MVIDPKVERDKSLYMHDHSSIGDIPCLIVQPGQTKGPQFIKEVRCNLIFLFLSSVRLSLTGISTDVWNVCKTL